MERGWYQVAFEDELGGELTPSAIGTTPLVLVRTGTGLRAFDAICPHRGAHLGIGGRLEGRAIVCPFHGKRIGLDGPVAGYRAREYDAMTVGGLVFVRLSSTHDNGLLAALSALASDHEFVRGLKVEARVPADVVIENAFDQDHFASVHRMEGVEEMRLRPSQNGELGVEGIFAAGGEVSFDRGQTTHRKLRFCARVFSPGLCVSELGDGQTAHGVVTAATPLPDGRCTIRLTLALLRQPGGRPPERGLVHDLLRSSRKALDQDLAVWENLCLAVHRRSVQDEPLVLAYQRFRQTFADEAGPASA